MENLNKTLDLMIKHNQMVSTNNFLMTHLGINFDEYQRLPGKHIVCKNHFEENCQKCRKNKMKP